MKKISFYLHYNDRNKRVDLNISNIKGVIFKDDNCIIERIKSKKSVYSTIKMQRKKYILNPEKLKTELNKEFDCYANFEENESFYLYTNKENLDFYEMVYSALILMPKNNFLKS